MDFWSIIVLTILFLFYIIPLIACITVISIATRNEQLAKAIAMENNSDLMTGLGISITPIFNILFCLCVIAELSQPILKRSGFYNRRYYKD